MRAGRENERACVDLKKPSRSRLTSLRFAHPCYLHRADDVEHILASLVVVEQWSQDFQHRKEVTIANPANGHSPNRAVH
jgi:hypothetical protein